MADWKVDQKVVLTADLMVGHWVETRVVRLDAHWAAKLAAERAELMAGLRAASTAEMKADLTVDHWVEQTVDPTVV